MLPAITLRNDLQPGDLGRLIALHGELYEGEAGEFGIRFEAYVAKTIAEYIIDNDGRGRIWLAELDGELVGTCAMVERDGGTVGQLRWVLLSPAARGTGLGERLVRAAIEYARDCKLASVFLETTDNLDASMGIYRKLGFAESRRHHEPLWTDDTLVITMSLKL